LKKVTIKGTPEMMTLAQRVKDVQDACNLCGVVQHFAIAIKVLRNSEQCTGTRWANQHPITRMWIDKLEHLARMEQHLSYHAYEAVDRLAAGEDSEWEIEEE
jgi:hypothetical protein